MAAQDYRAVEVVVVDDGSGDGSAQTAREVLDQRGIEATLLADGVNRGLGNRLNQVLELAQGTWVVWLAADDQFQPGALSTLTAAADNFDRRGVRRPVGHRREWPVAWLRAAETRGSAPPHFATATGPTVPLPDMFRVNNFVPGGMALIRRQVLLDAGGYDPAVRTEDFDMWLRIGWTTRFRYVPSPAGRYRVVPGSTSRSERVNTLDQAAIMGKHWASAPPALARGYARLAVMRWALAVARARGRSPVRLREVAEASGIPMSRLLREVPAAALRPIGGAVWSVTRLVVLRAKGVRG